MAEKIFYTMGEVAEMFDVNTSLIRHWESQFSILRPKRNKKGNRLFSPQDVEHLKMIYHLVKECGMTLDGAKKALRKGSSGRSVGRDTELMERLQRIRSLLLEVREDLKSDEGELIDDGEDLQPETAVPAFAASPAAEPVEAPVEEPAAESGEEPEPEPEEVPAAESEENPADESGEKPETEPEEESDVESVEESVEESVAEPVEVPAAESEEEAEPEPEEDSAAESGEESEPEPEEESVPESGEEPEAESGEESTAAPVGEGLFPIEPLAPAAAGDAQAGETAGTEEDDDGDGEPGGDLPVDGGEIVPGQPTRRNARKSRRKKEEVENKELFAFYEQSLF